MRRIATALITAATLAGCKTTQSTAEPERGSPAREGSGGTAPAAPSAPARSNALVPVAGQAALGCETRGRVHFDFDSALLRQDVRDALVAIADCVRKRGGSIAITIAGHADDRGTTEYNLALGQRRAEAVKRFLHDLGLGGDRLRAISFGEEKPMARGDNENAWAQNRRAEIE